MLLSAFSETALAALELQASTYDRTGVTFIELLSMLTGTKKLIRLVIDADKLTGVHRSVAQSGLHVVVSSQELVTCQGGLNGDKFQKWSSLSGKMPRALYISKDQHISELAAILDMEGNDASLAGLLGYPECCQKAYDPTRYQNWWYWISHATPSKTSLASIMNRISRLYSNASYLYDYFPCSLDCRASKQIAGTNRSTLLTHGCSELVSSWDLRQSGEFLVFPDCVLTLAGNEWKSVFGLALNQDHRNGIRLSFDLP
jgi:hypothetical protein